MIPRIAVQSMEAYSPLKSLKEISEEIKLDVNEIVKLNGNENPFPLSFQMTDTINLEVYPDPESKVLTQKIANFVGLAPDQVFVGAGADEIIDLIQRAFLNPGDRVISLEPTFSMYEFFCNLNSGNFISIPMRKVVNLNLSEYQIPTDKVLKEADNAKMIFLSSPNNPDGKLVNNNLILELLRKGVLVVLDEAYIEFSHQSPTINLVNEYSNLIVLRTFSKAFGLAGMRIGYALLNPELKFILQKIKQPYNVTTLSQNLAINALERIKEIQENVEVIKEIRDEYFQKFSELTIQTDQLKIHRSDANFILMDFTTPKIASEIFQYLKQEGVLVRYYNNEILNSSIRVSIGRREQMEKVYSLLSKKLAVIK